MKNGIDFSKVDSPSHYVRKSPDHFELDNIECIDAMVAVFGLEHTQKYAEIVAFKYLWRMNSKEKSSVEDKLKAIWYLRFSMGDDPRDELDVREPSRLAELREAFTPADVITEEDLHEI
jgi:hypothetical protein